ncbi:MAG TPA: serine hydrolase domain-containing protein [Bryobacteraceae bacterium]|nr:serine hydrolase domain-containing protein [Bryobacteraceae bacterium]
MRRRDLISLTSRSVAAIPLVQRVAAAEALKKATVGIREQIPAAMKEMVVPGVAVALIKDGKVRWRGAFGIADVLSRRPIMHDTIFQAGSMSKPVFAYAVMKLAERGVLSLDTPLTKYTRKRLIIGDPQLELITARHVLSHSTGLPNWRSSASPLRVNFTPGQKYGYSGEGYYYLQTVVTELTGREDRAVCRGGYEQDLEVCATDISTYLRKTVLTPFRMESSCYLASEKPGKPFAHGHDLKGQPVARGKGHPADAARYASAGGLLTTASDYARFLLEVIDPRPADDSRLSPASIAEMLRPHTPVETTNDYKAEWALGWRVVTTRGGFFIGHGGDNPGSHCLSEVCPARKSGFVIMTNGDGGVELIKSVVPAIQAAVY